MSALSSAQRIRGRLVFGSKPCCWGADKASPFSEPSAPSDPAALLGNQCSASCTYAASFVVVDLDLCALFTFSGGRCATPALTVTVKMLPFPSLLSTKTVPP